MKIVTALRHEFDCEDAMPLSNPPLIYLYLRGASIDEVKSVLEDSNQYPVSPYPFYNALDSVTREGAYVRAVLKRK